MTSSVHRLGGLLLLAAVMIGVSGPSRGAEPLLVSLPKTSVVLRFCHCPKGEIQPGGKPDPDNPLWPWWSMRAFHIGESEVTWAEFTGVMGKDALTSMLKRLGPLGLDRLATDLEKRIKGEGDPNEPVFLCGIEDAVAFCNKVNALLRADREAKKARGEWVELMEEQSVRLPTHLEWMYACRAVTDRAQVKETPHFPRGKDGKAVTYKDLSNNSQQRCIEAWQASGKTEANTRDDWLKLTSGQFQERLIQIDAAVLGEKRGDFNNLLKEFFEKSYGWPTPKRAGDLLDLYAVRDAKASSPNAWGVWGMLDNVTEWVMHDREGWAKLEKGDFDALKKSPLVFLAGGSFTSGYTDQGGLAQRTIWGGPFRDAPGQVYDEKKFLDKQPGFRLVLERRVMDNWLYQTRKAWIVDGKYTKDAAEQLRKTRAKIESLFPDKQAREKHLVLLVPYELQVSTTQTAAEKQATLQKLVNDKAIDKNDKLLLELTEK